MANPPTPASEGISPAMRKAAECKKLKEDYRVVTRTHRKGARASSKRESHHVLQDKALKGLISKYSGWAILLTKTEHKVANAKQIARNCNGGKEGQGPKTFGALKKAAKADIKAALKNRKHKDTGKPISGPKLEKLAQCILDEAVKETNKKRKKNKNKRQRKPLKDGDGVKGVKGCLGAATLVWLARNRQLFAAELREGMQVRTSCGLRRVQRVSQCGGGSMLRLGLAGEEIDLSPEHVVQLASGAMRRAGTLLPGHVLSTRSGPCTLVSNTPVHGRHVLYGIAMRKGAICHVGALGLNIALPGYAIAVKGHVRPLAPAALSPGAR